MQKASINSYSVSAGLKNGGAERAGFDGFVVPRGVIECERLWKGRGVSESWPKDQWAFVRASIEPLLYATIDPEDVHYENGLLNPRGTIYAQSVELTSVSFENGPIPVISAYACFELIFDRQFKDNGDFYDWMEATDWLDWSTNFGWRFPGGDEFDAAETHHGIELELLIALSRSTDNNLNGR